MTKITPMELLNLFHKSDSEFVGLSIADQKLLSVLITFINVDLSKGYKAWPNNETIKKRTGLGDTVITGGRKRLLSAGWLLSMEDAKGPGKSIVYYINAQKIIDVAKMSGSDSSKREVAEKPTHKRNTSGLLQNKNKKPDWHYEPQYDEDEPPF